VAADPPGTGAAGSARLVSVVVNFLDAERFLEETIASVYAQSYQAWELLLIDDGSTDGSTAIARRHAALDPGRVRYLEHPGHENRGASAARNLGIAEAQGELIAFLDSDDVWLPQRLQRSVELFDTHPTAAMVYGESEYWYSWAGSPGGFPDRVQPHGFDADRIVGAPELLIRYLTHTAALPCTNSITVRRVAAQACRGFVSSFRGMHDDQAFLARICLRHEVYVAHECWDRYRQHDASLCAQSAKRGEVAESQRAYLAWLHEFLEEQGMRGTRVWEALRYAERVQRHQGRGWYAMAMRKVLRGWARVQIAMRHRE
jgi:glycosyltransferase involved in cell wall biosynthesis